MYEVIYNLCDNAIKYNVEGGSMKVSVGERDGKAFVSVADTGIGIAPEHQSRIFERFYRVDKSHSKASGGTGLGLPSSSTPCSTITVQSSFIARRARARRSASCCRRSK